MAKTINKTIVEGTEEVKKTLEKREGRFFLFFKTVWWEEVAIDHIGSDIYIKTDREIRQVYLNGKPLI
jgi:hypothetical protein